MSIEDLVNVSITATGQGPTRDGFGVPLIAAVHSHYSDKVRPYSSLAGIIADGFATTDPVYKIASVVFAQQPRVRVLKIGKRTSSGTTDLVADLGAMQVADPDWYGLLLDSNTDAETSAVAAWVEANEKLFAAQSSAAAIYDPGSTTDVAYTLKHSGYVRTSLWYHPSDTEHLAAGILADRLPDDPGSDTWAYKSLASVASYALTDAQRTAILAKNANIYTPTQGENITEQGKTAGGEWVDVTRFVDWLTSEIRAEVFTLLLTRKLPFEDGSVELIKAAVYAVLKRGIRVKGLAASPAPFVDAPKVADVSSIDRGNRHLPAVTFTARLAGAIHTIDISGTVSA